MRATRDEAMLRTAFIWAEQSTCSRLHVGAVFAREGRILVQGYNGAPAGMTHCSHDCTCTPGYPYELKGEDRVTTVHSSGCIARLPCTRAVHAEQNAIAYAARWGVELKGSTLYCTHQPCLSCALSIVNLGLELVIYCEPYRLRDGLVLLEEAGLKVLHAENPNDRVTG